MKNWILVVLLLITSFGALYHFDRMSEDSLRIKNLNTQLETVSETISKLDANWVEKLNAELSNAEALRVQLGEEIIAKKALEEQFKTATVDSMEVESNLQVRLNEAGRQIEALRAKLAEEQVAMEVAKVSAAEGQRALEAKFEVERVEERATAQAVVDWLGNTIEQLEQELVAKDELSAQLMAIQQRLTEEVAVLGNKLNTTTEQLEQELVAKDELSAQLMAIQQRLTEEVAAKETALAENSDLASQLVVLQDLLVAMAADLESAEKKALSNLSMEELTAFLVEDKTNLKAWSAEYNCGDFATDLDARAEAAGYKAGFAWVVWEWRPEGKWGHFMNAFTLDSGETIFVEPQTDEVVRLQVGGSYWGQPIRQIMIAW